ncbi:MAG: SpoIIE family protein phosphatase [Polyangiaceae bacterium]
MKGTAIQGAIDPLLARQLTRAGASPDAPPTQEAWAKLVRSINDHYRHAADDRALLTRSMELSTAELEELRRRVERQRDQLRIAMLGVSDALSMFEELARSEAELDRSRIESAKTEFSVRLADAFAVEGDDDDTTAELSGMRTNLVRLADQLIRLLASTAAKAALDRELAVARTVQQLLVPPTETAEGSVLRVAAHFQPASECGGDWWGFYPLPGGRDLVVIGDVIGHGIASALMTGVAKAACELSCHMLGEALTPAELLRLMNVAFCRSAQQRMMMSACAALFDRHTGVVSIAGAGHPFPYLLREGMVQPLAVQGQPFGADLTATYESMELSLRPRDVFVFYTDGLIECENAGGEQFSERRFRVACQRASSSGAPGVRDAVIQTLSDFAGDKDAGDDITLVVSSVP